MSLLTGDAVLQDWVGIQARWGPPWRDPSRWARA